MILVFVVTNNSRIHLINNTNVFCLCFQVGDTIESEIIGIGKMLNPVVADTC